MGVVLNYESGFPTLLEKRPHLETMLAGFGQPVRIENLTIVWRVCGLGYSKEYRYSQGLDVWRDGRRITSVELRR
jgi:hypothetical protein